MEMTAAIQNIVAVALGVLAIIWNQQRSLGNLRRELQGANSEIRRESGKPTPGCDGSSRKPTRSYVGL